MTTQVRSSGVQGSRLENDEHKPSFGKLSTSMKIRRATVNREPLGLRLGAGLTT
ncbi:MAG: hypothetical protein DDT30_00280 [Dehalococcoidia bacterium]|nr:hypothetical protein [Bacillota bacterium]